MKHLKAMLAIMTALLVMTHQVSAATFKDVSANHWAKAYIDRCTNEGIIKGFPDNTFRPDKDITFTELSSLLSSLLNVSEAEMQTANTTYGARMIQLGTPDWVRPAVLKCLYRGVYDLQILEAASKAGMLNESKRTPVSRANCAVFFSQALGMGSTASTLGSGLKYNDLAKIPQSARGHIQALQTIGVLSAQGDGYGYFRPDTGIDRASIAKMLTVALDYLKKNGTNGSTVTPSLPSTPTVPTVPQTTTVTGTVKSMMPYNGQTYVVVSNGTKDEAYSVDMTTKVTIDGTPGFATQIAEGMEATLLVDNTTKRAVSGTFKTAVRTISGVIKNIPNYGSKIDLEYKEGNVTKTETFDLSGASIKMDRKDARFSDLRVNFEIRMTLKGTKVTEVEVTKATASGDGYFRSIRYDSRDRAYVLEVYRTDALRSSDTDRLRLSDNLYFNSKRVRAQDLTSNTYSLTLQEGMPLQLKTDSRGDVTEINVVWNPDVRDGYVWGFIYETPRYNDTRLTIADSQSNYSAQRFDLQLPRDNRYLRIYTRNNNSGNGTLTDLRRDDWVKVTMKNGEVDTIEVVGSTNTGWGNSGYGDVVEGNAYFICTVNKSIRLDNASSREYFTDDRTKFYDLSNQSMNFEDFARYVHTIQGNNRGDRLRIEYRTDASGRLWVITATVVR